MPELGAKFGRWLDLVLLQLRLDNRAAPPEAPTTTELPARSGQREFVVAVEDPRAPDVRILLDAHLAFSHAVTPPGHVHALGTDGLLDPAVTFFAARRSGTLIGVGALKELDPSVARAPPSRHR